MSTARHPRARHFSSDGLFRSLRNFAELEERIASLESPQDRGDAFEVFAEAYLATQRVHQAEEIWPGNSLPVTVAARLGLPLKDMGVDGVFRAAGGSHHAYQVKFRRGRPALGWAELATFMGLSDRAVQRVVFTNCESLPEVMNERRGFVCVRGTDLDRLTASDFKIIEAWVLGEAISRQPKTPAPHQREALENIASGLNSASRATVVMACGTGKTLVALWAAEEMGARRILVLLPSLALVRQTLHEWLKESNWPALRFIAVCSDRTVMSGNDDGLRVHQSDLDFAVTTEADVVRNFMDSAFDGVKVVFSTYQSARVVAEAVGPQGFDLGVFDEAHKTTGLEGKAFSLALEDRNLPIAKRLFMTATPRHYDARKRDAAGERKLVYSMDAPDTYGSIVHTLSFSEAARRGIVCHCKIIISVVTSDMINAELLRRGEVLVDGGSVHAGSVANQIALQKACETYGLKKVFSFHSSVSAAQDFTNDSPSSVSQHLPGFEVMHVSGAMPTARRERIMQSFRGAARAVIANARCLTEGVDVPAVDVVAFVSPRRSKVDIVQAAGRALRNSPGKSVGYVLLPLFVETSKDETVEQALVRTGFEEVWSVLSSLAEQDDALVDTIRQMREDLGRSGRFSDDKLRETVEVIGQTIDLEALRSAVSAQIVEYVGASWDERLGQLEAYSARHGHCRVPARWQENPALGLWVVNQRRVRKAGKLSPDRIARLDALGFDWGDYHQISIEDRWEAKLAELEAFRNRFGHCLVPSRWPENPVLGLWVVNERRMRKANKLPSDKIAQLDALGFEWGDGHEAFTADRWEAKFAELKAFRTRHGHCLVPSRWPENPALGLWVVYQRRVRRAGKLSPDRIARLDALGFEWGEALRSAVSAQIVEHVGASWDERLGQLAAYKSRHGHCRVPARWPENPAFGLWVVYQRRVHRAGKLSRERIARLDALGFEWGDYQLASTADRWESKFSELEAFRNRYGHCLVPYRWPENPALGLWVVNQRRMRKADKLPSDRIAQLDALEFMWSAPLPASKSPVQEQILGFRASRWNERVAQLTAYKEEHGNCRVPDRWAENPVLARWVVNNRQARKAGRLSKDRIAQLDALGFMWSAPPLAPKPAARDRILEDRASAWKERLAQLTAYKEEHGDCRVPFRWSENPALGRWVGYLRKLRKAGKLSSKKISQLEALGFDWGVKG